MTTAKPRTRLSADERRAQIVAAARAIALEEGLAGVTLRSVASRLGVASGLVAHYEPSMEALVARTFADIAAQELAELTSALTPPAASPGTAAAARRTLALLLTLLLDPARDAVSSVWADAWSLGRRLPLVAEAAREGMDRWTAEATRILREGHAAGAWSVPDVDLVALQLFALVDSTTAYALVGYKTEDERSGLVFAALESALGLENGALRNP
ncbi:TetR/AcrR family transcriptional regulator [Frondihabitans australicus]|uniref:TetR family transcriptional regulator n=1 Tax=Frondihabitans australicus TaxID=386892 RepID=A0A495IMF2_9MICO|nr:TetR family transcriptional regulator [Frondihabitans australicus]RKR76608.1 TetR family transcriptional regulator [Frondihabitans australicus]